MTVMAQRYFLESVGGGKDFILLKPSPPGTETCTRKKVQTLRGQVFSVFSLGRGQVILRQNESQFPKAAPASLKTRTVVFADE
jgi:hypothetical protein